MSADIPRARELLAGVLRNYMLPAPAASTIQKALSLMTRSTPIKRTKARAPTITPAVKAQVRQLARDGKSNHEIAEITGLRNQGRVSEILTGKR